MVGGWGGGAMVGGEGRYGVGLVGNGVGRGGRGLGRGDLVAVVDGE